MPAAALLLVAIAIGVAIALRRGSSSEASPLALELPADWFDFPDLEGSYDAPAAAADALFVSDDAVDVVESWGVNFMKRFQLPARAAPYADAITEAEAKNGLPIGLLGRQLYQESAFRADVIDGRVRSSVGATGIAQFMPATAKDLGVDPLDPFASIEAAGRYMRQLFNITGDWKSALAAYNWGVGNVTRKGLAAAPAETRNYVASIAGDVLGG